MTTTIMSLYYHQFTYCDSCFKHSLAIAKPCRQGLAMASDCLKQLVRFQQHLTLSESISAAEPFPNNAILLVLLKSEHDLLMIFTQRYIAIAKLLYNRMQVLLSLLYKLKYFYNIQVMHQQQRRVNYIKVMLRLGKRQPLS